MKHRTSIVVILQCLLVLVKNVNGTFITVETSNGLVRGSSGLTAVSRTGLRFYQFLGLPYAKPPIGSLRFSLPEKPENWTGVKDAIIRKRACLQIQMITGRMRGSEDCLYLNIFTPNLRFSPTPESVEIKVPVMVFIHGGGFMSGNVRTYGPKYFMDENVILVTVAYRLGSFGFLSTGDEIIRGNMGLHDQVMALRWIQDNISNFGGDPNKVTLFGESSGGSAVHWHLLSPQSTGLFHRAISESGSALRRYPNTVDFAGQARSLANRVGCATTSETTSNEVAQCLKRADAKRIVETHRDAMETYRSDYAIYGPIVESVKDANTFISEEPEFTLLSGNYNKVPWISGVNRADGIIFATGYIKDRATVRELDTMDGWITHLPRLLRYDQNDNKVAEKIREFYFGNGLPSDPNNFQNLINMFSDRMYFLPNFNSITLQSAHSPVYLYYFDYKTVVSLFKVVDAVEPDVTIIPPELQIAGYFVRSWINETVLGIERQFFGAAHADELFLLFNINPILDATPGTADYLPSRSMVKAWADFAKSSAEDTFLHYDNTVWPPVSNQQSQSLMYLQIGNKGSTSVINDPVEDRMRFWKSLNLTFLGRPL